MRRRFCFLLYLLLVSTFLISCGGTKYQKKLPGKWYVEGNDLPAFVLYDDGTCEIAGEYGEGTWSVVNENELKLTNYYGETETGIVKKVDNDKLVLTDGNSESVFYSKPQ